LPRTPKEEEDLALAAELRQKFKLDNYTPRMVLDYIRQVFSVNTGLTSRLKTIRYPTVTSVADPDTGSSDF
jgi:hypothetical protein